MRKCLRLKYFTISFFAPILGFAGLTIVLQKMEAFYNLSQITSNISLVITVLITSIVFVIYMLKLFTFPEEVKKEFLHPVKINFFPAFPKGLLILSIAFLSISLSVSKVLWIIGVVMNLIFTLLIFREYLNKDFHIKHINPARFIPIVTNIVIPITGIVVFPQYPHISRFFFSVGLVFWLLLFFVIMYRMIFHSPLPQKLLPTMMILIAPPAIAFISYLKLTGGLLSPFASILFYLSVFLFLLILVDVHKFFKIKFYLSRRAYSFPLAAFALANVLMYHVTKNIIFKFSSTAIAALLLGIIILLIIKTASAIKNKSLCVEEED